MLKMWPECSLCRDICLNLQPACCEPHHADLWGVNYKTHCSRKLCQHHRCRELVQEKNCAIDSHCGSPAAAHASLGRRRDPRWSSRIGPLQLRLGGEGDLMLLPLSLQGIEPPLPTLLPFQMGGPTVQDQGHWGGAIRAHVIGNQRPQIVLVQPASNYGSFCSLFHLSSLQ